MSLTDLWNLIWMSGSKNDNFHFSYISWTILHNRNGIMNDRQCKAPQDTLNQGNMLIEKFWKFNNKEPVLCKRFRPQYDSNVGWMQVYYLKKGGLVQVWWLGTTQESMSLLKLVLCWFCFGPLCAELHTLAWACRLAKEKG